MILTLRMTRAATTLADPVRAVQGATSDWACVMANSSGHMSHDGAHGTGGRLVAPNELARLASLQLVATRQLRKVQDMMTAIIMGLERHGGGPGVRGGGAPLPRPAPGTTPLADPCSKVPRSSSLGQGWPATSEVPYCKRASRLPVE